MVLGRTEQTYHCPSSEHSGTLLLRDLMTMRVSHSSQLLSTEASLGDAFVWRMA